MTGSEVGSSVGRAHGNNDNGTGTRASQRTRRRWKCPLVLSRLSGDSESVVRVRVATFSPTPHHPKVIVLPEVPFPLLEAVVDRLQVCRHAVSTGGIVCPSWNLNVCTPDGGGLVLTAEEIKDVVSSMGLWLVVREH